MNRLRRSDRGFTLVELLVSISVLGVVLTAVTGALIAFLSNGTYTLARDDHSAGAALMTSYLNRDFASADTMVTGGAACTGAGTTAFTLTWTEWTATAAQPSPAPGAGTWNVSYVVTPDVHVPTRYQLERRHCPASGPSSSTLLARDLVAASPAAAVLVPVLASSAECPSPSKAAEVRLPAYSADAADQRFSYVGCIGGRTT